MIAQLDARSDGQRYLWIPRGLQGICAGGAEFPAEATLSRFEIERTPFYTLVLRDLNERLEADRKIQSLTAEAEYLREEIKTLAGFGEILVKARR